MRLKVKVGTLSSYAGPYAAYDAETGTFVGYTEANGVISFVHEDDKAPLPLGTQLEVVEIDESAWD